MAAISKKQIAKLDFELKSLRENLSKMREDDKSTVLKALKAGAIVFANAAAKHTPPDMGKNIDPLRYIDGVVITAGSNHKPRGRRIIIDLLASVRESRSPFRSVHGQLLKQGWKYIVFARGRKRILCKDLSEAQRYAHLSYRGLMRAAWGLDLPALGGKLPPAFAKLITARNKLMTQAGRNQVRMDSDNFKITIENRVLRGSEGFVSSTTTNAEIAALKTINTRLKKHFQKKEQI